LLRATHKGLGTLLRSAWDNYDWDEGLLLLDSNRAVPEHPEWYPDVPQFWVRPGERAIASLDDRKIVEAWLRKVDVLFSAETLYDPTIQLMAEAAGVRTVVQGMPEFYRPPDDHKCTTRPNRWCWPTDWLIDEIAPGPIVPVPVTGQSSAEPLDAAEGPLTVVHVAGYQAAGDRNGTELFLEALSYVTTPARIRIYGQDGNSWAVPRVRAGVDVEVWGSGADDRWSMYDAAHLMVMPRRYGGLCLPVNEAFESGLAVAMTDMAPNTTWWPTYPINAAQGRVQPTPFGRLTTGHCDPRMIASAINRLGDDRAYLARLMAQGQEWVANNTWDTLRPRYDDLWVFE
jgi:hypothetical protein